MEVAEHVVAVTESSQVGEARRFARGLAERVGFDETEAGRVAIVAAELATNLVKHAPEGGHLIVRALERGGVAGVELLALDQGPGMRDVSACMRDGYSTAGSSGTGLGALVRLSSAWDIHSMPDVGTAVLARHWPRPVPDADTLPLDLAAVRVPARGEVVCGDAWAVQRQDRGAVVMVADGLGHGAGAADAADAAIRSFGDEAGRHPADILDGMHRALRATRGAAVAVAEIDLDARAVHYAGVGNIHGVIVSAEESRSMVSHGGIVGHEVRRIQEMAYPIPEPAVLVMHSDGLSARWDLFRYPGLLFRPPALIAGVLWRDFGRGRDDATVVVARIRLAPAAGADV